MWFLKKKFYREVPCKACDGTGILKMNLSRAEIQGCSEIICGLVQGICFGCKGKGTQTVLEREE